MSMQRKLACGTPEPTPTDLLPRSSVPTERVPARPPELLGHRARAVLGTGMGPRGGPTFPPHQTPQPWPGSVNPWLNARPGSGLGAEGAQPEDRRTACPSSLTPESRSGRARPCGGRTWTLHATPGAECRDRPVPVAGAARPAADARALLTRSARRPRGNCTWRSRTPGEDDPGEDAGSLGPGSGDRCGLASGSLPASARRGPTDAPLVQERPTPSGQPR